ncbi:hypothetical protein [Piscinibacter sp. XHJ-5]|uniref:hypothetical protein n=1 Tax=Piscinibacter sp. XHJ-5 TaxID=3037797 RepID=UPI002452C674|nr:hypothetical protein [Piscinibacter sp. XHJ-5]
MLKLNTRTQTPRSLVTERRVQWSLNGFGAVLLVYVVGSAALEVVPDGEDRAMWLGLGVLFSVLGMAVGAALAALSD